MTVTITYDSIFDVETYLNNEVGLLTPVLYDWFFERMESDDIKQCELTTILKLLTTIIASDSTTVDVYIVTYGCFDGDLNNSLISLFDSIYKERVKLKFIEHPKLSDYNIVTNIMKFMEFVNHPNETMSIYYQSTNYGTTYGKEEIDVITKVLNPAETLAVDTKYFRSIHGTE